jgi:hypothetical protein
MCINRNYTTISRHHNSRLLQRHFRYVNLPPALLVEITLSRMTAALAAILVLGFDSRSHFLTPGNAQ